MSEETKAVETDDDDKPMGGAFFKSLRRTNKDIRSDRAQAIAEGAQLLYRREVEDLNVKIKQLKRDQEGMLDMSPDNALSLKLASTFDAKEFVATDTKLALDIRNAEIKLELAQARYNYLFGAE